MVPVTTVQNASIDAGGILPEHLAQGKNREPVVVASVENAIAMGDYLFPDDAAIITEDVRKSLKRGNYEQEELNGLKKIVDSSSRVIELGAGIGYISAHLRRELNVKHVSCVEANPVLAGYIRRMHELNKISGTDVQACAAFPDDANIHEGDKIPFYVTEPFWSSSLAMPRPKRLKAVVETSARYLSDLIREIDATVIVCDIEGGEKDLFTKVDFGNVQNIFLELHSHRIRGDGVRSVFDTLHRQGFCYDQNVSFRKVVNFKRW